MENSSYHQNLSGQVWLLFALDLGYYISLSPTQDLLSQASPQEHLKSKRSPIDFGPLPRPVVWEAGKIPLEIKNQFYSGVVRAVIYDFGLVSFSISFDFSGSLLEWRDLSIDLNEHLNLRDMVKGKLDYLLNKIKSAIEDFRLSEMEESYFVFQINPNPLPSISNWFEENQLTLAQIIRGETADLTREEIEESLRKRKSYSPKDLIIVDWTATLILDENYKETLAVLDFANGQLLEMRFLDDRLDGMLEGAYRMVRDKKLRWRSFLRPYGKPIRQLVEFMADAASQFEAVNNALKLTNDQFLARVYLLASERFRLKDFEEDINRKLNALSEIHQVFIGEASNRRQEYLEWVIILLITLEIILFLE